MPKNLELGQFFMVVKFITQGQIYPWVDPLGINLAKIIGKLDPI